MSRKKAAAPPTGTETIAIDLSEPVHVKDVGGANSDRWNGRLINNLISAIPGGLVPDQRTPTAQAVITAIDHPFAGAVRVQPEALSAVLEDFGAAARP